MPRVYQSQVQLLSYIAEKLVNSWPSPVGDGTTDVNIEYEIDSSNATIENVAIIIPLPM